MTTPTNRPRPRRGIFLVNILMAIGLLAAFVIVAERVFRLSLLTTSRVALAQDQAGRLERSLAVLRADVWAAQKVEVKDSRLVLTDADARTIEWRSDPQTHDLVRAAPGDERRWPDLALTFHYENGLLSVSNNANDLAIMRQAGGPR